MDESTDFSRTVLQRLDQILSSKGLSDQRACNLAEIDKDTIRNMRRRNRPARIDAMAALAKVLDVSIDWLTGLSDDGELQSPAIEVDGIDPHAYVAVATATSHFGMGAVGMMDSEQELGTPALLPRELIESELRGAPDDFVVADVEGQSMEPVLQSGDRVLIDLRKTNPSQAGLFALWDGFGLVIKWVERNREATDPPRLRILSENERFAAYEVTLDEARILGRVVWFARKL